MMIEIHWKGSASEYYDWVDEQIARREKLRKAGAFVVEKWENCTACGNPKCPDCQNCSCTYPDGCPKCEDPV